MKTARFERLSFVDNAVLVGLIASITVFSFPLPASAQTEDKTSTVFEIKNFQITKVAETVGMNKLAEKDDANQSEVKTEEVVEATTPPPAPAPKPKTVKNVSASKYNLPPKATEKVYMHEPEIRAYVCPKLGEKCDIFIAILKAENGTHECTRDNRGLNKNGSVDIGLAQINWKPGNPWHTFEQLQDCKYNLDVALDMYKRRGFQPWVAYNKGAYKKFLN
jgi:hypothetical protein